jgi:hypothetical protein
VIPFAEIPKLCILSTSETDLNVSSSACRPTYLSYEIKKDLIQHGECYLKISNETIACMRSEVALNRKISEFQWVKMGV